MWRMLVFLMWIAAFGYTKKDEPMVSIEDQLLNLFHQVSVLNNQVDSLRNEVASLKAK